MSALVADDRFVAAVEAIYDAAPDPSQWPRALAAIANVFGDVGGVLIWQKEDGTFGTVASASLKEANVAYRAGKWWARDTRAQRGVKLGHFFDGEPRADRHFSSDEEISVDPFYTDFLIPHGLGWIGTIAVSPDPRIGVSLSVQRSSSKDQFSDFELDVLARIARHVEKSLRLSIRLFDAELLNVGLGEALTRVGIGISGSILSVEWCSPIRREATARGESSDLSGPYTNRLPQRAQCDQHVNLRRIARRTYRRDSRSEAHSGPAHLIGSSPGGLSAADRDADKPSGTLPDACARDRARHRTQDWRTCRSGGRARPTGSDTWRSAGRRSGWLWIATPRGCRHAGYR